MNALMHRIKTRAQLLRHRGRTGRRLEIGPGATPLSGFETLNVVGGRWIDYVMDASADLPFDDDSFELIYASHVLEHVPWYRTADTLREWARVLEPGGALEVWVPNGLKIAQAFVEAELHGDRGFEDDRWFRFNPEHDPCLWASGRTFTYGDGTGDPHGPNWHRALFSPRRLKLAFEQAGLSDVREMDPQEVRGQGHGWINLGVRGVKP